MGRPIFSPLKLDAPGVFAVKVEGNLGTRQKAAVESLIDRCVDTGKTKVILDFSELGSLGGAVATSLASFSERLETTGHELQIVGASDVVQSFLRGRCIDCVPAFVLSVEDATSNLSGKAKAAPKAKKPKNAPKTSPTETVAKAVEELAPKTPAGSTGTQGIPAAGGVIPLGGAGSERRYFSLEEADRWLKQAKNAAEKKSALSGLLFGADLAEQCFLFHEDNGELHETEDAELRMPLQGGIAVALLERRGPVPIVDLGECELLTEEEDLLCRLNCQMAIPLLDGDKLEGILFLRKRLAGQEYESGEALALDLLVRYIGDPSGDSVSNHTADVDARTLKEKIYRTQTLARLSKDLNSIHDEEHLINVLLSTLMSELSASRVAYFQLGDGSLRPLSTKGIEIEELQSIDGPSEKQLHEWTETLVHGRGGGPKPLQALLKDLGAKDFNVLAPLRNADAFVGMLALGGFRGDEAANVDFDYLQSLLQHAGVAIMNTQAFRGLHSQTLRIARTIMGLAERRAGIDSGDQSDQCTVYVSKIARTLNQPQEELRDMLFATVLRDIGMIEISDLVLRSPRKLTPEEWKVVQRHPISGADILRDLDFSETTCAIVMHHHERYNGEGYPNGLRGSAIPVGARVISVVESYLAMTRELPYRAALSREEAIDVLRENWEMRYDPEVVAAFVSVLEAENGKQTSIDELLANF
jgi:anti-anti-sigma regulatory factor/GAF domain-containing protein